MFGKIGKGTASAVPPRILNLSLVILSEAKNLCIPPGVA
jgi:hypothetical protein